MLKRAKQLYKEGKELYTTPALAYLMSKDWTVEDFRETPEVLEQFARLDDTDLYVVMKVWKNNEDFLLSDLCKRLVNRKLFKTELQREAFNFRYINEIRKKVQDKYNLMEENIDYLVLTDSTSNSAYSHKEDHINILYKNGKIEDIATASDQLNIQMLAAPVVKYYLCYPKDL